MSEVLVNRVAESNLSSIDLETFYPAEELAVFDLKPFLFMELILKEKDFREALKQTDWQVFAGKIVGVTCSADAIVPMWAYMLVASYLQPVASQVVYGTVHQAIEETVIRNIRNMNAVQYTGKRVVVKGCGDKQLTEKAYLEITLQLRPVVKSIMYGEPCSTVPVYKQAVNR